MRPGTVAAGRRSTNVTNRIIRAVAFTHRPIVVLTTLLYRSIIITWPYSGVVGSGSNTPIDVILKMCSSRLSRVLCMYDKKIRKTKLYRTSLWKDRCPFWSELLIRVSTALYVHCSAHNLCLVVSDVAENTQKVVSFSSVREVFDFFSLVLQDWRN